MQRYSPLRVMSIPIVSGSLFRLPFSLREMAAQAWDQVSLGAWLALAYSIVPGEANAYVIWFKSIQDTRASKTTIYSTLMPPMAVLIAIVTLGERLTLLRALGAVVAPGGVVLTRFAPALEPREWWRTRLWPRYPGRNPGRKHEEQGIALVESPRSGEPLSCPAGNQIRAIDPACGRRTQHVGN